MIFEKLFGQLYGPRVGFADTQIFWGSCGSQLRMVKLYFGLLGCVPGEASTQTLF